MVIFYVIRKWAFPNKQKVDRKLKSNVKYIYINSTQAEVTRRSRCLRRAHAGSIKRTHISYSLRVPTSSVSTYVKQIFWHAIDYRNFILFVIVFYTVVWPEYTNRCAYYIFFISKLTTCIISSLTVKCVYKHNRIYEHYAK